MINDIIKHAGEAKFNLDIYNFLSHLSSSFDFGTYKRLLQVWKKEKEKVINFSDGGDPVQSLINYYTALEKEWVNKHPEYADAYQKYMSKQMALAEDKKDNDPLSEASFMAMRAGANGKTFGEGYALSKCCQAEIKEDACSICGQKEGLPDEKLNESINKIKNRF